MIRKFILCFILCFSFSTIFVSAEETNLNNSNYIDVSEDSEYYEAIKYLTDNGIVTGSGNGYFLPNNIITYDELTVMVMRSFFREDWNCVVLKKEDWALDYTSTAEFIGVYSEKEIKEAKVNGLTWDIVLRAAVGNSNFETYPYWIYNGSEPNFDYVQDIKYALTEFGFFQKDFDFSMKPTRGEVAQLLYILMTKENEIKEPEYIVNLNIPLEYDRENSENYAKLRSKALYDLTLLPKKYVKSFSELGWKIKFTDDMKRYTSVVLASGLTSESNKTITLSVFFHNYEKYTLIHEFGHFVDLTSDLTLPGMYMLKFEGENIKSLLGSYSQKNRLECFAESFRYVLVNRTNPEKYKEMKEMIPMTLDYIEKGYLDCEDFYDETAINSVTHQYFDGYANNKYE